MSARRRRAGFRSARLRATGFRPGPVRLGPARLGATGPRPARLRNAVSRAVLPAVGVLLLLWLAGCAPRPPVRMDTARTGETVLRVTRDMTVEEVALRAYDDASLAGPVAELARLEPGEVVPRGTVLVLPTRDDLEARLRQGRDADDLYRRGLAAADAETWREAADLFRRALAHAPQRLDARYNLGLALLRAGELAEATSALEAVAAARPDDAPSRYAFGSVLRRRQAWDRALAEFEAAVRLTPGDAAARYALARTLEDLDRPREARAAWTRFLDAFPDGELARDARRRLEALENPGGGATP